ncbi:hypothetical protein L6Q96_15685 [Candidatus Binatia bacterium]|nr:hypothetical protein [Candidatus Binatia bacterium]
MGRRRHPGVSAGDDGDALGRSGSALVELLVASLVLAILGAYAYGFVRASLAALCVQEAHAEAAGAAALAVAVWAQEVRLAGFDATGTGIVAVRAAAPTAVEVATDLDGDGDSDDPHERVAYAYDAVRRQVTRATAGGTAQPFLTDVAADGVRFRYFEAGGGEVTAPVDGLSAEARRRVRAIRFDLHLAPRHPLPTMTEGVAVRTSATVHLRNP